MNKPNHVAIIMDGNGRWAKEKGLRRSEGHLEGSKTLKKLVEYAFSHDIKILSVFAFSTENFKRSKNEVDYLISNGIAQGDLVGKKPIIDFNSVITDKQSACRQNAEGLK